MSWTYTGNPAEDPRDAVRFLVGDTDKNNQLLQDGEIDWVLSLYNNTPLNASIRCCEAIIAKFTRLVDESVGQVRMSFSQRAKAYQALLTTLRNRLTMEDAMPYAGGVSISDMRAVASNTNRPKPFFTRHMMEDFTLSPWVMGNGLFFTTQGDD